MAAKLRLVSLIPSATEIAYALGLGEYLVGRSHECDFPIEVKALPVCTAPKFDPKGSSREIHDRVTTLLQSALAVYRVNIDILADLQPTHILTQAQCEVCAVSLPEVEAAVRTLTGQSPQVISLQPACLADIWSDLERTALALLGNAGVARAARAISPLRDRLNQLIATAPPEPRPRVACIEWPDPLMAAGNWIPELVQMAGGSSIFGEVGKHSPWIDLASITDANPDCIVFMPCGYDLATTARECSPLTQRPEWAGLKAVKTDQVYVTDGNQYFNRPGPRLVDSAEILAEILHPDLFPLNYQGLGWQKLPNPN